MHLVRNTVAPGLACEPAPVRDCYVESAPCRGLSAPARAKPEDLDLRIGRRLKVAGTGFGASQKDSTQQLISRVRSSEDPTRSLPNDRLRDHELLNLGSPFADLRQFGVPPELLDEKLTS